MTHLGKRVQALVDGRLTPDAAERAHSHLAGCPQCRDEVAAERRVRDLLRQAPAPVPSADLVAGLLALGGPQGPLPPPPGRLPGAAAPRPAAWAVPAPAGRADGAGPGRRRRIRRRVTASAAGVLTLVSVGVLGLLLLGSLAPAQPGTPVALASGGLGATGAAGGTPARPGLLTAEQRAALRADGWLCPERLPGGFRLVAARATSPGGTPSVELAYSDGSSTVRVLEQRGRLEPADAAAFSQAVSAGARTAGGSGVPWHGLWQSGEIVVAVVADAPPDVVERAVPALTRRQAPAGWWDRVERGADAVAALLPGR